MGNSDPILKLLKDFSYAVVRLPRESIRPLQILEKQGNDLTILGNLSDLFSAGKASLPTISPDVQAAVINGKRTRALDINVGLSLLGGIVGAITGSKVKLDAAYKKASSLAFEFDNVLVNEINQLLLNKFLSGAKIDTTVGPAIVKALEDDRLYVIASTIKSKKFITEALQSNGMTVAIEIPVIKEVVGGSVAIKTDGASSSRVTFEGQKALIFGFQAVRLEFEKGMFKGLKQSKPEEAGLRAAKLKFKMLKTEGPFASLVERQGRKGKQKPPPGLPARRAKK